MSNVDEIKTAIAGLSKPEYSQLRDWFSERDWQHWDQQIEDDSKSGKLDFLAEEALDSKKDGTLKLERKTV